MAPLQFCTIASRQYLAHARALAKSIQRSNPSSQLWVLLVDDHLREIDRNTEEFCGDWNEELGLDLEELHRMFLIHGGYLAAIKPWFMDYVLRSSGGPILYVDSDIQIYGALDDIGDLIEEFGALLSPHIVTPYPLDGKIPDDTAILGAGTFNAGMIGVGRRGMALLEFLKSRLRRECYVDVAKMRVNEQRWLDFIPSIMFDRLHISRDMGVNAAYWNLHERPLSKKGGEIYAGAVALRAFHFSGYDLEHPEVLSRHAGGEHARVRLEEQPIVAELCARYRDAVQSSGYAHCATLPLQFESLPIGIPIDDTLRAVYRASVLLSERQGSALPPDGYDLASKDAFITWARWAYPAAAQELPDWAAPPSLEEVVRRLVTTTTQAVGMLESRMASIEEDLRTQRLSFASQTH